MSDLKVTTQERMEAQRESEWRRADVPEIDIIFSRLSGMDARDIQVFRDVSREFGLLKAVEKLLL